MKVPLEVASEATDKVDKENNPAVSKLINWAKEKDLPPVHVVGRDMGAAPPRQTEMRFKLPGMTYEEQLECALSAWQTFEIPALPEDAVVRKKKK